MHSFSFEAIGTHWLIEIHQELDSKILLNLIHNVKKRIEEFDLCYSRFREDSWIWKLSQRAGKYAMPSDFKHLLDIYKTLYRTSDGYFTPLIGDLLSDLGYDKNYSLKPKESRPVRTWEDVIETKDGFINLKQPALLDFGAGGKGYLIDIVEKLVSELGIKYFYINAGGDILVKRGRTDVKIGLENPLNPKQVIGIASISNQSICGSSGNRRKWDKYHHIIDPKSQQSITNVLAVWVVADTALIADCLSTYLFLRSDTIELKQFVFEYLILFPDFSVQKSNNFPAELFAK